MNKLKLVKTAVFLLTFLLVFGTLLVLGTLFQKTHKTQEELPSSSNLNEPKGSTIQQIEQNQETLYLLIQGGGQDDRVIIFDSKLGKKITTIKIN